MRAFSRQVHNIIGKDGIHDIYDNIDDRGRGSVATNELRHSFATP